MAWIKQPEVKMDLEALERTRKLLEGAGMSEEKFKDFLRRGVATNGVVPTGYEYDVSSRTWKAVAGTKSGDLTDAFLADAVRLAYVKIRDGMGGNNGKGREDTIGASEIAQCSRRVIGKRIGLISQAGADAQKFGFAARGQLIEWNWTIPIALHLAARVGGRLTMYGKDQRRFGHPTAPLSCTPDSVIENADPTCFASRGIPKVGMMIPIEMKSFDPRISAGTLPKPEHVEQLNVQMGLLRQNYSHQMHAPTHGIILYVNASDLQDVRMFVREFRPELFNDQTAAASNYMQEVNRLRASTTNYDERKFRWNVSTAPTGAMLGGKECDDCELAHLCNGWGSIRPNIEKTLGNGAQNALSTLAVDLLELKQSKKDIAEAILDTESAIRNLLTESGTNRATITSNSDGRVPVRVEWKKRAAPSKFNREKALEVLASYGEQREDFYTDGKESEYLVVKRFDKAADVEAVVNEGEDV